MVADCTTPFRVSVLIIIAGTKWQMATPRAYQLDHQADSTGKHIAATKRRILFRFGTLRPGHTRPSADDAQHIITLSWSPTSGHTILACNGREVLLRNAQRMPPRMEGRFEESWILGEEAGITSSNEYGFHLRIVARAVNGSGGTRTRTRSAMKGRNRNQAATGQRSAGTRCGGSRNRKGSRGSTASVRQFDLFIDGRSYFDLPLLNESTGELMTGPPANDNDNDSESQKTGTCDLGEEEEVPEEGASVEDWTATGSAIATASNDDDDNDLDSVDGFMTNIDLGIEGIGQEKANKGSSSASGDSRKAARGHRMVSAKSNLQRSTARTAEKTKRGTKKLATGTSKVLKSPIALIKRTSVDDRKGGDDKNISGDEQSIDAADGDVVEEESGCGTDPTASS